MSSVPLRARSPFFSFDTETGSKRPRWVVLLSGFLGLLLVAIGTVAGVGAANAHTPNASATCYQLNVDLKSYNGSGANSVKVWVDDVLVADVADFDTQYVQSFAFADATTAHTWRVLVDAHDDPGAPNAKGWDYDKSGISPTCGTPGITLDATVCNTVDGSTTLTATFSSLLAGQTYTAQLYKNGAPDGAAFVPSSATPTVWTAKQAGFTYRLEVKSTNPAGLNKSVETFVVACPQNSALLVSANECSSTTTSDASVSFTASTVVPGRAYTAVLYKDGTPFPGVLPINFTPTAGQTSVGDSFTGLPENTSGFTVVLTDVAAAKSTESTSVSTSTCPNVPVKPVVVPSVCDTTDGTLTVTVTFDNLVPTRSYLVLIDDVQVDQFVAASSSPAPKAYPVSAGAHVVKIVDEAKPAVFAVSDSVTAVACPTDPGIQLSVDQCSVPGGKGAITATFTDLGPGREYLVTITENGNAVPGYTSPITVTSASAPLPPFTGLDPLKTYTVTIKDKLAPLVLDAETRTLDKCPLTPGISLDLECLFIEGDSLITGTIDDLEEGKQYLVEIEDDSPAPLTLGGLGGGTAVTFANAPVDAQTITAGAGPNTVTFQVPNNLNYTVTVTSLTNSAITNSAQIFAAICDLPTFPLPPELPTLAFTGVDTTMPMLGALGLVQFGVALLALAAMLQFAPRRRRTV